MKFIVTLKDPDALYESLTEAISLELKNSSLPEDEQALLKESRYEKECAKCYEWIEYGEYYRIEFDTDTMTATVLKTNDS